MKVFFIFSTFRCHLCTLICGCRLDWPFTIQIQMQCKLPCIFHSSSKKLHLSTIDLLWIIICFGKLVLCRVFDIFSCTIYIHWMHGRRAPDVGCTCIRFKRADELENHSSVVWTNCYSYFPVLNLITNFNKMTQLCYYFWCCSIKLAKLRDKYMTKKVFDHFNLNSFIHSWGRRQIAFNWKCGLILAFF